MKECKILCFDGLSLQHGREVHMFYDRSKPPIALYDYPEFEEKLAEYLSDGWIIEGFSQEQQSRLYFVLTR